MKALYWISAFFYLIAAVAFGLVIFEVAIPVAIGLERIGQGSLAIASVLLLIASIGRLVQMRRD